MHLDNKVVVHRGVDMMNQRAAGLTLDWTSYYGRDGRTSRPTGGDVCVLAKHSAETEVKMLGMQDWAADHAGFDQTALDAVREFIYVCYQGAEESENTYFLNKDKFIKAKDVYMTFNMKDINATQYGQIVVGDNLTVDATGYIGTSTITDASGDYKPATKKNFTGTIVIAKGSATSMIDSTVTLYTVTIVC